MDDDDFNIPYIIEMVPNSMAGHQFSDKTKINFFIVEIYREDPIMSKGSFEELKLRQSNKRE